MTRSDRDTWEYLTDLGWQVTTRPRRELFTDYGLTFPDDEKAAFRNIVAVIRR